MPEVTAAVGSAPAVSRRITATIALGTLLNPLNSSMIAVGLVPVQAAFGVKVVVATSLISSFYLAACVAQPVMGRLADWFGPRRVFCSGLSIVWVASVVAVATPSFGLLVACRAAQAVGTSAAYPSGLAIIRRLAGGRSPGGALGGISATNASSAAFGPVLGGVLIAVAGWRGIFAVNIPLTVVALVLALRRLPPDAPAADRPDRPEGAGPHQPGDRREASRLRDLPRNRALLGVLAQQIAIQFGFYIIFYSLPLWLERARGFPALAAGLLMLPVAALGVALTPVAVALVRRRGVGVSLVVGSAGLLVGSAALLAVTDVTPVVGVVAVATLLGLPIAFNNVGLQAALYASAPASQTGVAAGLFQTCRYLGAILATALLGAVLGRDASDNGMHRVALATAALAAWLLIAALALPRRPYG